MRALHFGAGNIGRGFIGKVLFDAGYHVTFADVNSEVIKALQVKREYHVEVVGQAHQLALVNRVDGVLSQDVASLAGLEEISLVTTAVGPNVLPHVAKNIAQIIQYWHQKSLATHKNIIACENMIKATDFLKDEVKKHLNDREIEYLERFVGFANSAVDRIVPPMEVSATRSILDVRVEEFFEWVVDESQLKGELAIKDVVYTDKLEAFVERKLFTLNTAHASSAYAGFAHGFTTIGQAIADERVLSFVQQIMQETGAILLAKHHFDEATHQAYQAKIIERFRNPYLKDTCQRVGRDVQRKLGANDRFLKPISYAKSLNLGYEFLLKAVALALRFEESDGLAYHSMLNSEQSVEALFAQWHSDTVFDAKDYQHIWQLMNLSSQELV